MPTPDPRTVAQWHAFLSDYNTRRLASDEVREAVEEDRPVISEERLAAGWAGGPPAAEEALVAAEERLGVRLPPAYRNFLLASDGWEYLGPVDLYEVAALGWFADLFPELLEAWRDPALDFFAGHLAVLERCLLIGDDNGGSGCYWLLHADSAREDGEWTAYEWWPGDGEDPEPHDDFTALVREGVTLY